MEGKEVSEMGFKSNSYPQTTSRSFHGHIVIEIPRSFSNQEQTSSALPDTNDQMENHDSVVG